MIAFRGAVPAINWIKCAQAALIKTDYCAGCKIHKGFWQTYLTIRERLVNSVAELKKKYQSASVLVTGHSMGGGMATFAALDFQKLGIKVDYLITFG